MRQLVTWHGYILGFTTIGAWAVVALWALVLRMLRRDETPTFWRAVSFAQILLFVQLVLGVVLLLQGGRPGPPGAHGLTLPFHLLYNIGFPLLVLFVGHKWAREGRYDPHTVFAVVGLIIFGLTARGWMVGVTGY